MLLTFWSNFDHFQVERWLIKQIRYIILLAYVNIKVHLHSPSPNIAQLNIISNSLIQHLIICKSATLHIPG
jgi:hypothetical protein